MTCQYFSAVCLLCSLVIIIMTTSVRSRSFYNESHAIPPVISEGPSYHVYFKPEGNGLTLPCVATGTPPITYNWRKNGAPLEFNDRVQMGGGGGSLLMFRPTIASEGYYQCIASSAAGAAMSNITFVQAAVLEPSQDHRSRMSVKPLTAENADHLKFPCSHIAKSIPAPEFVWEKEDFPLSKSDNRITQTTDGWIVFAYLQPSDSGNYKCAPYNGILRESLGGSRFRLSVEVGDGSVMERKVHEAPDLIYSSPNATIVEGENLSLTCLFGSWPPGYQVEWTLPSGTMGPSGSSFVIENASLEDEGVYNCRAFKTTTLGSKLYSQTGEISVQIDAIPSFTIFPTNQEVVRGQRANFSCQGQGRPTPNVTWYANGISLKQIKDTDSYRPTTSSDGITEFLYLNDIQTTATVTCNISNLHGYRLHTAKIVFAPETDVDITNPSSQTRSVQPSKEASAELSSTPTKTSTEPSHKVITYSKQTLSLKENAVSKIGGPGNSDAHVSNSATSIIQTSVGVVGGLVVVVFIIIVVVVVCIRRRNRSTEDQVVPQDYRLRNDFLIVNNERVAYDSDDSGLGVDDQRTENIERRNLQQP